MESSLGLGKVVAGLLFLVLGSSMLVLVYVFRKVLHPKVTYLGRRARGV